MPRLPVSRAEILERIAGIDAETYARRRNHTDGGTHISAFLTRGLVSLPEVRDVVLQRHTPDQAYRFIFELAWREYWQREWQFGHDAIFSDVKRPQHPVTSTLMPRAVLEASTGIEALDAAVQDLYDTGYMHNHERMWLAGLVCNIARTHWWKPSLWLYYHLLDGDPASNSLSWQWVAGTNSHKKYLPSQENINAYSTHRQRGSIIDRDYGVLADMPVPDLFADRDDLDLTWAAPPSDTLVIDPAKPTILYHPFWLNTSWREQDAANRVVLLEPSWFARFPVSGAVTDHLLRCAREISGAQVVVADFDDLGLGDDVYFMQHPAVRHWRGSADEMPRLFPQVPAKSFGSFTSFWKQCQKTSR